MKRNGCWRSLTLVPAFCLHGSSILVAPFQRAVVAVATSRPVRSPARGHHERSKKRCWFQPAVTTGTTKDAALSSSRSARTQQKTPLVPARGHHGHNKKRSSFQHAVTTGCSKTLLVPTCGHHIQHRRSRSQQQKGCNRRSEVLEQVEEKLRPHLGAAGTRRRRRCAARCFAPTGNMFCWNRPNKSRNWQNKAKKA